MIYDLSLITSIMKEAREYILDRDDNTLIMDTEMYFNELQDDGTRVEVIKTPEEFRSIEEQTWGSEESKFQWIDWDASISYRNFRDDIAFLKDWRAALIHNMIWPSFDKVLIALRNFFDWMILTSREHSKEWLKMWKRQLIDFVFNDYPDIKRDFLIAAEKKIWRKLNLYNAVEEYLDNVIDYAVGAKDFRLKFNWWNKLSSKEWKALAMKDMLSLMKHKYPNDTLVSVGFSDDNPILVDSVRKLFEEVKYSHDFRNMHLVTYDTENPDNIIKTCVTSKQRIIDTLNASV